MTFTFYFFLYFFVCGVYGLKFDVRRHLSSSTSEHARDQNAICSYDVDGTSDVYAILGLSIYNTTVSDAGQILASVSKTKKDGKLHIDNKDIRVNGTFSMHHAVLNMRFEKSDNNIIIPRSMACRMDYMTAKFTRKTIEVRKVFQDEDLNPLTTQSTPTNTVSNGALFTELEASLDKRFETLSQMLIEKVGEKVDSIGTHVGSDMDSCAKASDCKESIEALASQVNDMRQDKNYVYDTETDGGDWLIIQRRKSGDVDFFRNWEDYKQGFGSRSGDFWLGNDRIHQLTTESTYQLRIDMEYQDRHYYVNYDRFWIDNEKKKYALHVSGFDGTAADRLTKTHGNQPFSTYDRDNDESFTNCASSYKGGWWYRKCHNVNLNGEFGSKGLGQGVIWSQITGNSDSLSMCEMKIRRVK